MVEYCVFVEPKEEFVKRTDYHTCLFKKERGLENLSCLASDETSFICGNGDTKYSEKDARKCPLYSNKAGLAQKILDIYK